MTKTIQYFTKEYLERCKGMTSDQIIEFLEDYRMLFSKVSEKSQLISLKIEPSLLKAFKRRAELEGTPYQTQIKKLMKEWLSRQEMP
jgi:predicted DNA binding CopG/RHH family protein